MPAHLVMPPPPHAPASALWDWVPADTPQSLHPTQGAPALDRPGDTVLIVPAAALSWHRVTLPPGVLDRNGRARNPAKLRAVLEGLLEDQLLDEPTQLHFALERQADASGARWVAVCLRPWLRSVMEGLTRAGHRLIRIAPEWTPASDADSSPLWITGDADAPQVLWPHTQGVLRMPLPAEGAALPWPDGMPQPSTVYAEPACAARAEQFLHREVTAQARPQRLQACTTSDWDLAQGEFASRHALWQRAGRAALTVWQAPAWRPARWALAVLCAVQLVGLNAQAWQARQVLSGQRSAMQQLLLSTFPATTVVVDAPLQMQRAVDAMTQASGRVQIGDLEHVLEAFGTLAPAEYVPSTIEFVAKELRLSPAPARDEAAVDALRASLQRRGYRSRVDGSTWTLQP